MRRAFLILCTIATVAVWSTRAGAETPTLVRVIQVQGPIDRTLLSYVHEGLALAEEEGAIVVLQIDTPGALDENGVALADLVANLRVPVLAWVGPAPAKAAGAGLLLMYASSIAAVAPGSQTGPLTPIDQAHPDATEPGLQSTIRAWLDARRKDTRIDWPDGPLTGQQAVDLDIAFGPVVSVPDLLDQVDGNLVQTPSGPVTLETHIATDASDQNGRAVRILFDNPGPLTRVLHAVATPSMIYWLLVIGLAAIAFELTQPGFGFAGFVGLLLLGFAIYGMTVVPVSWLWFAVLLGGIGLLAADVQLRRLGVLTALGIAAFGTGSFLAWSGLGDDLQISPWLIGGAIVASLLYFGFGLTVAVQSRDRIANTQRGLIGLIGEARGRLAPDGPVYVKGALWRGRSTGEEIASGSKIRVRGVDGLILKVEEEVEADPEPVGGIVP